MGNGTISTAAITAPLAGQRISKQVHFVLCSSCFWCASYLDGKGAETCLSCHSNAIEAIPIAPDEKYAFDYDAGRGVTVEFLLTKSK